MKTINKLSNKNTLVITDSNVVIGLKGNVLYIKHDNKDIDYYTPDKFYFNLIFSFGISGYITIGAIKWLSQRNCSYILSDLNGNIISYIIPNSKETDPHILLNQFNAYKTKQEIIANHILNIKYINQNKLLESLNLERITKNYSEQINAKIYFQRLNPLINQYGYDFESRAGIYHVLNKTAVNMVNACLNLSYGYILSKLMVELESHGLTHKISFIHKPQITKLSLAYDLLEYLRSDIDKVILSLLKNKKIQQSQFNIIDHTYYLHKDPRQLILNLQSIDVKYPVVDLINQF